MKVMDHNGRLFGKISIIDVLVVLVVIALAGALYVKSSRPHTGTSVATQTITYQVLVEKEPFESAERSAFGLQLQWDVVREGYVRAGDMLYPEDGSAAHCTVIFTVRPLQ